MFPPGIELVAYASILHGFSVPPKKSLNKINCQGFVFPPGIELVEYASILHGFSFNPQKKASTKLIVKALWYLQESNQGHMDFQSIALPTELRYHWSQIKIKDRFSWFPYFLLRLLSKRRQIYTLFGSFKR